MVVRRQLMKMYKVPYDIKREEKIFGGYLSLRQVLYLMLTAGCLAIFAISIPLFIRIIFASLFSIFFLLCAFLKVGNQNFDKFFFLAIKFLFRKKNFVYGRCL